MVTLVPPLLGSRVSTSARVKLLLTHTEIKPAGASALALAIVGIGFFKNEETIRRSLKDFQHLVGRVRKMRLMGAAALDAVYVAAGRFDAYIEYGIKLWDICAGELILDCAGGKTQKIPTAEPHTFAITMWNGKLSLTDFNPPGVATTGNGGL